MKVEQIQRPNSHRLGYRLDIDQGFPASHFSLSIFLVFSRFMDKTSKTLDVLNGRITARSDCLPCSLINSVVRTETFVLQGAMSKKVVLFIFHLCKGHADRSH